MSPDLTCLLLHIIHSLHGSFWLLLRLFLPSQVTRLQDYLLSSLLSGSVSLQAPVTPMYARTHCQPTSIHSPWHIQPSTMPLWEPFSILTFTGMNMSCASSVLSPLTTSTPQTFSILFPADRTDSDLEQMTLFFPALEQFLPAGRA